MISLKVFLAVLIAIIFAAAMVIRVIIANYRRRISELELMLFSTERHLNSIQRHIRSIWARISPPHEKWRRDVEAMTQAIHDFSHLKTEQDDTR